jgi:hypothetical protein
VDGGGAALVPQAVQGRLHGGGIHLQHRVAVGGLVAAVHQGVEGQRIVLGGGELLFQQNPQDPQFKRLERQFRHGADSISSF